MKGCPLLLVGAKAFNEFRIECQPFFPIKHDPSDPITRASNIGPPHFWELGQSIELGFLISLGSQWIGSDSIWKLIHWDHAPFEQQFEFERFTL